MNIFLLGVGIGVFIGYLWGAATVCVIVANKLAEKPKYQTQVLKFERRRAAR